MCVGSSDPGSCLCNMTVRKPMLFCQKFKMIFPFSLFNDLLVVVVVSADRNKLWHVFILDDWKSKPVLQREVSRGYADVVIVCVCVLKSFEWLTYCTLCFASLFFSAKCLQQRWPFHIKQPQTKRFRYVAGHKHHRETYSGSSQLFLNFSTYFESFSTCFNFVYNVFICSFQSFWRCRFFSSILL